MSTGPQGAPSSGASDEKTRELVRVIESDHKATVEFIARLATLRAGVRGVVITLASAFLALAASQKTWPVAVLGVPIVVLGYFAEARMEFISRLAHDRAVRLERKIQAYVATLIETGTVANDASDRFKREIDTYQFGASRSLRSPRVGQVLLKSLRDAMTWVYVAFVIVLVIVAIFVANGSSANSGVALGCVSSGGSVLEVRELPKVRSGEVSIVSCPP